jgi:hypothetical protein
MPLKNPGTDRSAPLSIRVALAVKAGTRDNPMEARPPTLDDHRVKV